MKKLLVAGIAAAFCGAPALAADIPTKAPAYKAVAPMFNWTGFYVGGSAGWAHADVSGDYVLVVPIHHSASFDSFIGGGHIGAQYQFGNWLIGIEAAYSGLANSHGSSLSPSGSCLAIVPDRTCVNSLNNIFTVGGRFGAVFNQWLLYGTGGYASGKVDTKDVVTSTGVTLACCVSSERQNGWYVGVGAEYMITPNWIAGVEYQHVDLGRKQHDPAGVLNGDSRFMEPTADIVRARLSYLFNWGKGPVSAKY